MALDISKVFDRVWHAGLLHKLKSDGIFGQMLSVILPFMVMILLSILSVTRHLICANNLNWLLNLNLIYDETLWTGVRSGLLISLLRKLNWFHLTSLMTMVLLM